MSILEFEKTKVFHQRSSSKLLLWTNTIKRLFNFSQVDLEHKLYDSRRHTQWIPVFHNHCWFQKLCFSLSDNYHCSAMKIAISLFLIITIAKVLFGCSASGYQVLCKIILGFAKPDMKILLQFYLSKLYTFFIYLMDSITIIPFHTVGDTNMEARKSTIIIVHASSLGAKYNQIQRKGPTAKLCLIFYKYLRKFCHSPNIIKYKPKSHCLIPNFPWNNLN